MNRNSILYLYTILLVLVIFGCGEKKNETQIYDLPGIETTISKIQISPLAYDRAIVSVKGIVAEINETGDSDNSKEIIISDPYQNTQKLTYDGDVSEISPGDLILISGRFDRSSKIIMTDRIMKIPYKIEE